MPARPNKARRVSRSVRNACSSPGFLRLRPVKGKNGAPRLAPKLARLVVIPYGAAVEKLE